MNSRVRDGDQPLANASVGSGNIQYQPGLPESRGKGHDKAVLKVMVKPLNLALGLGAIGAADLGGKSILLGNVHQLWVPAMLAGAVDIALNDDGLGVVEQQLMRGPSEEPERRLNAVTPGSGVLVAVELDESCAAPAQRGDEGQQWVITESDDGEINLHLKARLGLEARYFFGDGLLHGVQESSQHAVTALVTPLTDLTQQHAGGDPLGPGGSHALEDIGLERIKLAGSGRTRLIPHIRYGQRATDISANGLTRA